MSDAAIDALRGDDDSQSGSESSDEESTEDENEDEKSDDDGEERSDDEETGSLDQMMSEDDEIGETENADQQLSEDDGSEVCPICLNKFLGQELGLPENCDHIFCLQCIVEWSKNVNTCPIDRTEFSNILMKLELLGKVVKKVKVKVKAREPEDALPIDNTVCEVCRSGNREDRLLLCDSCDLAYHCDCLDPPLWRVPVQEWFCPPCARILNRGPHAVRSSGQRRVIPRTIVSETVRTRIQRLREILDNDDDDFMESLPVQPRPSPVKRKPSTSGVVRRRRAVRRRYRRRTPKKPKVLARTKQSVQLYGKTKVRIDTGTKTKYRRRRRKTRRYKKRKTSKRSTKKTTKTRRALLASKPLIAPSTKQRIADHLGLCKPPAGHTMPYVKKAGSSLAGENTLLLFGNKYELIDFEDDSLEETSIEAKPSSIPSNPGPSGYSASNLDILGSIMAGQSILHKDSTDITIGKDGSLKLKELPTNKRILAKNEFVKTESKNVVTDSQKTRVSGDKSAILKTKTDVDGFKKPQPLIKKEKLIKGNQANSAKQHAAFQTHKKPILNKSSGLNNVQSYGVKSEKNSFLSSTDELHSSITSDSSSYREFQNKKRIDENTEKENACVKKIKSEKREVDHHKRKIKVFRGESDVSKHQKKEKTCQNHSTHKNDSLKRENAFEETGSSTRWKSDTNSSLNSGISTDVGNSNQSFLNCNSTIISYTNATTTDISSFPSLNTGCPNVTYTSNDRLQISKFKKEKVDHDSSEENIDIVNNTPVFDRQLFPLKAEPVDVKNVERLDGIDISENVQQNINCKSVKSEKVSTPEECLDKNNLKKREKSVNVNYLDHTFESGQCPDPIVPKKHIKLEDGEKSDSESDMDIMITECNLASEEMPLCNFVDIDNSKLAIKIEGKRKISSQEDSDDEVQVLFQSSSEINNCRSKRKRKFSNNAPDFTIHPVTLSKVKIEKVSDNEYINVRSVQSSGNFEEPLSNTMPTSSKTSFSEQFHNTSDCDDLVNGSRQCTTQSQNMAVQESVKSKRTVSLHSNIRGETCNVLHDIASVGTNNVSLPINEVTNGESNRQASHFDSFDRNLEDCHKNSVKGKVKSGCESNSNPPVNSMQKKKAVISKTDNHSLNLSHDKPVRKVSKSNISDNQNASFENDIDLPFNVKIKKEPIDPENDDLINISSDGSVKNVLRNSVSDFNCRNSARPLTNITIKTESVEISEPENIGFTSCSDFNKNVTTFPENDTLDARESAQENIDPSAAIKIKTEPTDSENVIPNCYFYENLRNLHRSNISGDLKSVYKNTNAQLNISVKDKLFKPNGNDAMDKSNADVIDCHEDRTVLSEMLQKHENMITSFSNDVLSNREPEHENDVSSSNVTIRKESVSSDSVASNIGFYKSADFSGNRTLNNIISCQGNVKNLVNVRKESMASDDGILPNFGTNENKNNSAEIVFDPNKGNSPTPLLNVTVKKEHMSSDVTGVKKLSFGENDMLNEGSIQGKNSAVPFNVQIKKEPFDSDVINHCKIKLEPKKDDVNLSNGPIDVKIKTEKPYFDHEDVKYNFGNIKKEFTEDNALVITKQAQRSSSVKIKMEKSERKSVVPHKNPFDFLKKSENADQKYVANGSFPTHKPKGAKKEEKEKSVILPMNSSNSEMPVNVNQELTFNGRLSHNGQQTNIIPRYSCKIDTSAKPDKKIIVVKELDENSITQSDAVNNRTKAAFNTTKEANQGGSMTVSETDANSSQEEQVKKIQTDTCDINQLQMPANQNGGEGITALLNPPCPVREEDHTKLIGDNLGHDHKNHRKKMEKEKLEKKVKNEIAKILHPLYKNGTLTKKLYFSIEKKCLLKILGNCKGVFNPEKIKKLVCEYVTRMTKTSN